MSVWSSIFGKIIGDGIGGKVVDYFGRKAEIKAQAALRRFELEQAVHERRMKLIEQGLHADAAWEIEQIRNSGWKDEFVLILLAIPLVLVFIPATQGVVMGGFTVLEKTPDWYRWLILSIFTAIYGIRIWRRQQTDTQ